MDLDELQSVQSRERQTDSLQQLRATFYQDAAEFIHSLEDERDAAAERAEDPWNAPEVGRLNDDIDTAEGTVEAIYERRVGKIVKMASLAAADMPTEDDGLTDEERELFETLVNAIEENRRHVFAILDGEDPTDAGPEPGHGAPDGASQAETVDQSPAGSNDEPPAAGRESEVDAADLMGGSDPHEESDRSRESDGSGDTLESGPSGRESGDADGDDANAGPPGEDLGTERVATGSSDPAGGGDGNPKVQSGSSTGQRVDRTTVRITSDVGEIFGVDERAYDLNTDDVVTLPAANAAPLVDSDAAERLE